MKPAIMDDSLSTTVKPGNFCPALPDWPSSGSTVKPRGLISTDNILSHLKTSKPAKPLSPREQFAEYYGFSLPPPPPSQPEDPITLYPYEYEGGLIRPNPFTTTNVPSSIGSSFASEGWNKDLTCRFCLQKLTRSALSHLPAPPAQFRRPQTSYRASPFAQTSPPPLEHDELLANFNEQFVHSRMRWHSRKSAPSRKKHAPSWVKPKKPSFTTRPWSYDGVQTYPVMKLPPKKVKKVVKEIVEGEEVEVEIEVEVYEVPKKLFNFAPKVVLR